MADRLTRPTNRVARIGPRAWNAGAEPWTTRTSDGITLRGWYLPTESRRLGPRDVELLERDGVPRTRPPRSGLRATRGFTRRCSTVRMVICPSSWRFSSASTADCRAGSTPGSYWRRAGRTAFEPTIQLARALEPQLPGFPSYQPVRLFARSETTTSVVALEAQPPCIPPS
jgi:hypothetical protein